MPGEPAETLLGVGAVGAGALLLYCAYKNVSPFGLIKQAITTGDLDPSKVPPLIPGTLSSLSGQVIGPTQRKAIADIAVKDPGLAAAITKEMIVLSERSATSALVPAHPYSDTKKFFDYMSQARTEGFDSQADVLEKWVNDWIPASTTPNAGGGMVTI